MIITRSNHFLRPSLLLTVTANFGTWMQVEMVIITTTSPVFAEIPRYIAKETITQPAQIAGESMREVFRLGYLEKTSEHDA